MIKEYSDGRVRVYDMDVYGMEDGEEDMGVEEYFEGEGVWLVEWGDVIGGELPWCYLKIEMVRREGEEEGDLTLSG
ncbi:tRNA (adenosine(37)-N6)-threonylcarbamoyltransferase complex ATPase subunit type 1 TsaE, partial [Bacillus pumilus]|uniref:tRNA (adenosine(37)-N6)-threonylcarbamoyltransferase complex ATPase subunit type 1 TsaE n=1 Tax=Bacillus pumilus TaxID=1408 RepID=UPI0028CB2B8D